PAPTSAPFSSTGSRAPMMTRLCGPLTVTTFVNAGLRRMPGGLRCWTSKLIDRPSWRQDPGEEAERMTGPIGVHAERLLGIVGAVLEPPGTERECSPVVVLELLFRAHHQVEVQLLRNRPLGPGRLRQRSHGLESDAAAASGIPQNQPVLGMRVRLAGWRRLVTLLVVPAEQRAVELR